MALRFPRLNSFSGNFQVTEILQTQIQHFPGRVRTPTLTNTNVQRSFVQDYPSGLVLTRTIYLHCSEAEVCLVPVSKLMETF